MPITSLNDQVLKPHNSNAPLSYMNLPHKELGSSPVDQSFYNAAVKLINSIPIDKTVSLGEDEATNVASSYKLFDTGLCEGWMVLWMQSANKRSLATGEILTYSINVTDLTGLEKLSRQKNHDVALKSPDGNVLYNFEFLGMGEESNAPPEQRQAPVEVDKWISVWGTY